MFLPFSNSKGAISGVLTSLAFTIWLFVGNNAVRIKYPKKEFFTYGCNSTNVTDVTTPVANIYDTRLFIFYSFLNLFNLCFVFKRKYRSGIVSFYSISYTWYGCIAVIVACTVGSIVSLATGWFKYDNKFLSEYLIELSKFRSDKA